MKIALAALVVLIASPALADDDPSPITRMLLQDFARPSAPFPFVPPPAAPDYSAGYQRLYDAMERERVQSDLDRLRRENDDLESQNRRLQIERDWDYPARR